MSIKLFATIPFEQIADIGVHLNTKKEQLTCAQVKAKYNADYVMNIGFYDMTTYSPVMALKVNNEWKVKENNLEGISFDKTGVEFGLANDSLRANFVASYPTLIRGGQIANYTTPPGLGGYRGRTGIGIDKDFNLMLACIEEVITTADYSLPQLAQTMYSMGAKCFINVDGGLSSQCIFPSGTINSPRTVQSYLYIKLYEPMYRVQMGAFRNRAGADNYKITCKNAMKNVGIDVNPIVATTYM